MRCKWICIGLIAALFFAAGAGAEEEAAGPDTAETESAQDTEAAMMEEMRELYGDEAFVTIATGSRKPIFKAPAVASVITAKEIKAMGARNLNEVLETVPGLHVSLSTLSRLDSVYSIRGIHTAFNPQVLFLINSLPFQDLWTGAHPILFRLPVASISRIEVIRGPGSAIYGADAFSGVINIITKDADEVGGTELGARRGSFDTTDFWLQHGGTYKGWDLSFSLEWQESDGDLDRVVDQDSQTIWDQFASSLPNPPPPASLAPGPLSTRYEVFDTHLNVGRDDFLLRFWNWRLNDAGVGAGGAQALDPAGSQSNNLYLADLTWQTSKLVPDWDLSARTSYQFLDNNIHFVLLPPGTLVPIGADGNIDLESPNLVRFPDGLIGNPDSTSKVAGLDLTAIYSGWLRHRLRVGGGFRYQRFKTHETKNFGPGIIEDPRIGVVDGTVTDVTNTPFVYAPDKSRKLWYISLQDEWQLASDWELTAGVRYDHYSDFGDTVNPRLALVWATRYNLTSKLLYGRAFRAPSFSELYAINNPSVRGNPDLQPETIDTIELSFDYRPIFDLQTVLSLFAYRADDLIEFVPDPAATTRKTAKNARDQKGYGFELEMNWQVNDSLRVGGNYAWQHSEDADSGRRIPDAPGQQLLLMADWRFQPNWYLHPQLNWVGNRKRAPGDNRPEINDYTWVDLTLRRKDIWGRVELAMAVRNLFDEDAREPSDGIIPGDYPLEGRSYWIELSWRI